MKRQRVAVAGAGLAGLVRMAMVCPCRVALAATTKPEATPVLMDAMDAELHRAMSSLGGSDAAQPKPYFLSYAVSDSDTVAISAQYGAITSSTGSRRRSADVQVRLGTAAQDNTHGDHRNSALTSMPLPLTDDHAAMDRSLWLAPNRGYAKA